MDLEGTRWAAPCRATAPVSLMRPSIHYRVGLDCASGARFTFSDHGKPTGVMRFLQTEWHRHERDRNAWEIERQEMKARIAALEGQARRADATQKALKKYVTILEKKVKDQSAQLKGGSKAEEAAKAEKDRATQIQEKLRCESVLLHRGNGDTDICFQPRTRSTPTPEATTSTSTRATTSRSAQTSSRSWTSARPNLPTY